MNSLPSDRPAHAIDPKLLEILVCPLTKGPLEYDAEKQELISRAAKLAYPIRDGIPIMLPGRPPAVVCTPSPRLRGEVIEHCHWREEKRDQNLGPEYLVERAEGDVGGRRDRLATRAHRYWRGVRQESRGGLSGDEPERAGADARRGRRLPAVGIELDRALSRRQT